jgi:hypothetical protein
VPACADMAEMFQCGLNGSGVAGWLARLPGVPPAVTQRAGTRATGSYTDGDIVMTFVTADYWLPASAIRMAGQREMSVRLWCV